jgi:hypothetical protein
VDLTQTALIDTPIPTSMRSLGGAHIAGHGRRIC